MWLILDAWIAELEKKSCSVQILSGPSAVSCAVTSSCCGLECMSYLCRNSLGCRAALESWGMLIWGSDDLLQTGAQCAVLSPWQKEASDAPLGSGWLLEPWNLKAEIFFISTSFLPEIKQVGSWLLAFPSGEGKLWRLPDRSIKNVLCNRCEHRHWITSKDSCGGVKAILKHAFPLNWVEFCLGSSFT